MLEVLQMITVNEKEINVNEKKTGQQLINEGVRNDAVGGGIDLNFEYERVVKKTVKINHRRQVARLVIRAGNQNELETMIARYCIDHGYKP